MNNLRKIGLSALAGSLASVSAHAAEVSVSGSASITMDRVNKHLVTGNDFSMGDSLGFNMSGETDGGLGVAVYYEIDGGALDDYDMTLSGDWGSLKFNGSGSSSALGAVDDVMPNAYEESWDILDTDGTNTTGSPLTIGGGGGANDQSSGYAYGGAGGGLEGGRGGSQPSTNNKGGRGGRQIAGYDGSTSGNRVDGSALRGGDGNTNQDNPGGGGGYYGGQSGSDDNSGAGGGSGYIGGNSTYKVISGVTTTGSQGAPNTHNPPQTGNQYYVSGVGTGYQGSPDGGDGRLVILY